MTTKTKKNKARKFNGKAQGSRTHETWQKHVFLIIKSRGDDTKLNSLEWNSFRRLAFFHSFRRNCFMRQLSDARIVAHSRNERYKSQNANEKMQMSVITRMLGMLNILGFVAAFKFINTIFHCVSVC